MNTAELLADLQTKCVWVGTMQRQQGSPVGPVEEWTVPVIQIQGEGTYSKPTAFRFTVLNNGVVAGPQTYAADVLDMDGVTVLHAAGDPVLDENGDQVVVPPQAAETVLVNQQIKTPVTDTMMAVGYLEAQRLAGTWLRYVEDDAGPKRPDLKFFAIKAWVDNGNGTVSEKRYMVAYDDQGQPFHTEIV
jgi:hypothetical protein